MRIFLFDEMRSLRNSRTNLLLIILSVVTSLFINACESTNSPGNGYVIPEELNDGWKTASLNSVGMEYGPIENLMRKIDKADYTEIHSVVIVKENKLVFEKYRRGHDFGINGTGYHGEEINFNTDTRHNTHSATKSFTSALIGIAIDKGFIGSINDPIFNYLPNHKKQINAYNSGITIKDCLKMASGFQWNEWDAGIGSSQFDLTIFNNHIDPLSFLLSKPVVTKPGTSFYYNGATVDLLGYVVTTASKKSLETFSKENLFEPLGITNYNWSRIRAMTCAHGDIYITPRDMAKFGQLFLNGGKWNGERIISEEWINESTRNHISPGVDWADGYGYLWWMRNYYSNGYTYNAFRAHGWGGQQIIIFGELNMVVVFTGANYTTEEPCDEIVRNYILPAIQ